MLDGVVDETGGVAYCPFCVSSLPTLSGSEGCLFWSDLDKEPVCFSLCVLFICYKVDCTVEVQSVSASRTAGSQPYLRLRHWDTSLSLGIGSWLLHCGLDTRPFSLVKYSLDVMGIVFVAEFGWVVNGRPMITFLKIVQGIWQANMLPDGQLALLVMFI